MLKKILKISAIIVLLLILAGFLYWVTMKKGWPWWVGATIFSGIIGLVVAAFFLKRYLLRRRERKFVRRVVELDESAIKGLPIHERQQLQELQEKWKESVELLRDSYLRKKGNPLYALPWYLVIGESGAGKTSAIKSARLSSPLTDIARTAGITATRNCDWWFFEEAIILDSAGRYTIPIEEDRDREEWERFLTLLSQYRRKEPLNGAVVAIAADALLAGGSDKLRLDGQSIRKRIDQLMRVTGAKFPVYILVTKMDMVFGFAEFFNCFPDGDSSQAMGYMNRKFNPYWHEVLAQAWANMTVRLRDLRLMMTHQACAPGPAALVFPGEFERLRPGLEIFVKSVFEENPYQETPPLRGLYFSSARQDSQPTSELFDYLEQPAPVSQSGEVGRDLFLKDFFRSILPGDRTLFSPILEFIRWRRLTANSGLLAWLLICLSLCGVLTMSFIHNRMTLNKFRADFKEQQAVLSQDATMDLIMIERMRLQILDLEKANRYWLIPRLGLDDSLNLEKAAKAKYARLFKQGIMDNFDRNLLKRLEDINRNTPEDDLADYFSFVVARISVLREYVKNGKIVQSDAFQKSAADLIVMIYPKTTPDIAAIFDANYYAYMKWGKDKRTAETNLEIYQTALASLQKTVPDMKWLVRKWIPNALPVQLKDLWGEPESTGFDTDVAVSGAYTSQGRKNIEAFIGTIETVTADKEVFAKRKIDFWNWYLQEFTNAWTSFARHFPEGEDGLQTLASQRTMATLMTTDHSPYFLLIRRIAEESAWISADQLSPWLAIVVELNEIQKLAKSEIQKKSGSFFDKIAGEKEQLTQQIRSDMDRKKLDAMKKRMDALKVWQDYVASLDKIGPAATSQEVGYRMAADFFTLPAEAKESNAAIYLAYSNYLKLKGTLSLKGDTTEAWDILIGPIGYLLEYCIRQTSCYMKQQWESQVIGGIQGAPKDKLPILLFDKTNGLVWKFVGGPANPFITKSTVGYISRKASIKTGIEKSVPFNQDFLSFLSSGAEGAVIAQPEYLVQMETLPVEVNDDAGIDPYANILTLQCTDAQVVLKNFNYPQKATIRWAPDKCADTTLQILFPGMTLTKAYPGHMGFAQFLSDFKSGSKTFSAGDFPELKARLTSLGVTSTKISYRISGSKPVIQLLKKVPSAVPLDIVKCEAK
ncbi:MAG: type VI secretion protein IcmF/TssM N-terminal domain-containing protein [Syntrophales bacterium]